MNSPLIAVFLSLAGASLAAAQGFPSTGGVYWGYAAPANFYAAAPPTPTSPQAMPMPQPVPQDDGGVGYRLLVFTAQACPKVPRTTHSWAALVRIFGGQIVDVQTISWMPCDLKIKPYDLTVEPGRNLTLQETIAWIMGQTSLHVTLWMPLDASPEFAARFYKQKEFLDSGAMGYQCLDFLGEASLRHNGCNCIHALTPLHDRGLGDVMQLYGDASGRYFVDSVQRRGLAVATSCDPAWLLSTLGLDGLSLRRR